MASIFETMQKGVESYNAEHADDPMKSGRQASMPTPTAFACPTCDKEGKEVRLLNSPGKVGLYCANSHEFHDIEALQALKPRQLAAPAPKMQPPPAGAFEIKVMINQEIQDKLTARFGVRLNATVSALLAAFCDPSAFIVSGIDLKRLEEKFGQKIKDSNTLIGLLFDSQQRTALAESENEIMKMAAVGTKSAYVANPANGDFVLNFGDLTGAIEEKAKDYGITKEQLIINTIKQGSSNGWW